MTARRCSDCRARAGAHFHWCPTLPAPAAPEGTAHLGHFQAPESGFAVNGVPVVECTSAVLCPECLGDWCEACDFTGMAQPAEWRATELPDGVAGEAPAAGADLATAVARWCTEILTRKEAA